MRWAVGETLRPCRKKQEILNHKVTKGTKFKGRKEGFVTAGVAVFVFFPFVNFVPLWLYEIVEG